MGKIFNDAHELNKFIQEKHNKGIGEHNQLIYEYDNFHIINKKKWSGKWVYTYVEGKYKEIVKW